jgi:hypothetical protein
MIIYLKDLILITLKLETEPKVVLPNKRSHKATHHRIVNNMKVEVMMLLRLQKLNLKNLKMVY